MNRKLTAVFRTTSFGLLALSIVSCSEQTATDQDSLNSVDESATVTKNGEGLRDLNDILLEAEAKYLEAKNLEHAWKATPSHLETARKALEENDLELARSAANRALYTANASVAQAMRGKEDWREHVVK